MSFDIGNYVSRISHNNDIVFKIIEIHDDEAVLQGINVRLSADAKISDLVLVTDSSLLLDDDNDIIQRNIHALNINRDNYFYLPGKILHIDGDNDYLERCMFFYKSMGIQANGITIKENLIASKIQGLIKEYRPDIVVITGHDAYYSKKKDITDIHNYQNTIYFINAIKEARKYEKNQDKLIIIAGACQSNYEELIKAGANFASSPPPGPLHHRQILA